MTTASDLTILIGPEDPARLQAINADLAPRLDYRVVAQNHLGSIRSWYPPPSGFQGPRLSCLIRSFLRNLWETLRMVRLIPRHSIVYSTGETWGLPVALVGALQRRRDFTHVVYVHRVFSPGWLRFLRIFRNLLAVDGWICVTQNQAQLLAGVLGKNTKPVIAVTQGVDTVFFDASKANLPPQKPYILAVGAEMRNYNLFFDVVQDLDIDVIVKASSAWMKTSRQRWTSVPPNVEINMQRLSYVELRDLYMGAALVVAPLYDTPQAAGITTILEAMAMQKCVVATQSRGLPDVLTHDKTGMISAASSADLARSIEQLLVDRQKREALAVAGRQEVMRYASLENHATMVSEFLLSVHSGRLL